MQITIMSGELGAHPGDTARAGGTLLVYMDVGSTENFTFDSS